MKTEVNLSAIELLHASKSLISLGRRIEELKSRGYRDSEIVQVLSDYKPETIKLASKFLFEIASIKNNTAQ